MSFWLFWVSLVLSDGIEAYFGFCMWVLGSRKIKGWIAYMWTETVGKERDKRSWKWKLTMGTIGRSRGGSKFCKGIWQETFEAGGLNWGEIWSRRRNWQQKGRIEERSNGSFASRKIRPNAELVVDEMDYVWRLLVVWSIQQSYMNCLSYWLMIYVSLHLVIHQMETKAVNVSYLVQQER